MAGRVLVAIAVVAIVAIITLYLALIYSQGGGDPATPLVTPFVASYLVLAAISLSASLFAPAAVSPALRAGPSAGLVVLGVLAAFSIGIVVLIAAGLAIASTVLALRARPGARSALSALGGAMVAIVILVAGFQIAWSHIVCPPSGEGGGTEPSFVGPGASYDCSGGALTVHR